MDKLVLMTGIDIPIVELQLSLHQPSIKEISYLGESNFFSGISCFCVDKNLVIADAEARKDTSNFQIFMAVMSQQPEKKQQVLGALQLFFPECKSFFTPNSLILSMNDQSHIIDGKNFETIQKIISKICRLNGGKDGLPEYNPKNAQAQAIADKLMRGRQRVAEINAAKGEGGSCFARYLSVIPIAIPSMSLTDAINLTIYQFYELIERYSKYINWDIDIRARLAGAKGNSEIENWMDDIQ